MEPLFSVEQLFAVEWALYVEQALCCGMGPLLWNGLFAVEQALCCGTGPKINRLGAKELRNYDTNIY